MILFILNSFTTKNKNISVQGIQLRKKNLMSLIPQLATLATVVEQNPQAFVTTNNHVRSAALDAVKLVFNLCTSTKFKSPVYQPDLFLSHKFRTEFRTSYIRVVVIFVPFPCTQNAIPESETEAES
jgi:hypothetical protein